MKRNIFRSFRLTIIATFIFYSSDAQVLLNELDPNTGNQFIELYNGGATTQSLDCYTLVVLKQRAAGTEGDFYVIDFNENQFIAAGGFLSLSNTNWATLGSLKQYTFVSRTSSPVYSSTLITTNPANLLAEDQSKNAVFLFKGGGTGRPTFHEG